jgi:hypothetical protein
MPGAVTTPLAERQARYELILAARESGMTLEAIGGLFDPPLTKQRIQSILRAGSPRSQSGGRPRRA